MSLSKPTNGDIIDRLSILGMKPTSSENDTESIELLDILLEREFEPTRVVMFRLLQLAAINGRLWEMHERPEKVMLPEAIALNQLRRKLILEIDGK